MCVCTPDFTRIPTNAGMAFSLSDQKQEEEDEFQDKLNFTIILLVVVAGGILHVCSINLLHFFKGVGSKKPFSRAPPFEGDIFWWGGGYIFFEQNGPLPTPLVAHDLYLFPLPPSSTHARDIICCRWVSLGGSFFGQNRKRGSFSLVLIYEIEGSLRKEGASCPIKGE